MADNLSVQQYSELFLKEVLEETMQKKKYDVPQNMYRIGEKLGIKDHRKIINIYNLLENRGLVKSYAMSDNHDRIVNITGEGEYLLEIGGESGILGDVLGSVTQHIDNSKHDNSITVHGNNTGQIVSNSSHVTQSFSYQYTNQIKEAVSEIKNKINNASELQNEVKHDAISDIEIVEKELIKKQPRFNTVKVALENLSKIASIATSVVTLIEMVKHFF